MGAEPVTPRLGMAGVGPARRGLRGEAGRLEQDACRTAAPIAHDPAAGRVGRATADREGVETGRADRGLVEGPAHHVHRAVSGGSIELRGGRAPSLRERERLIAMEAKTTSGRRVPVLVGDVPGDLVHQSRHGRGAPVERVDARVGGDEVGMLVRVDERGQDGAAGEMPFERAGRQGAPHVVRRAHRDDSSVEDTHGVDRRQVVANVSRDSVKEKGVAHSGEPLGRWDESDRSATLGRVSGSA